MVWAAGQLLYGGRYAIEAQLGQGGFGITYLARDRKGNLVVIKTLKDEVLTDPEFTQFREKFQRDFRDEALRLALCRHPHIVQVENCFHEGQLPCIAMEYVEGEELRQRVKKQGALSEPEALLYIRQIGEALTVIHDKGLLHRDVKPHNIMVRKTKLEAVLIDFGIAREFIPDMTLTHTQALTHGFAPIEQYAEQAKRGEYTDVYALAGTLYYLLTAKVPTPAPARAAKISLEPPQQINSSISNRVAWAIVKGMAFEPEERPQSVQDWLKLLEFESSNDLDRIQEFSQFSILSTVPANSMMQSHEQLSDTTMLLVPSQAKSSLGLPRILWVDDNLTKNAREVSQLRDKGVEVVQALSTAQAMEILNSSNLPFDAVISDKGRREEGEYRANAGITLIKAIRSAGLDTPIFLYTSGRPIARNKDEVLSLGANGITNSAVELFSWLRNRVGCFSKTTNTSAISTNSMLSSDNLSSEVGIDYTLLRELLSTGKWQDADAETATLMVRISGCEDEDWLDCGYIENFPSLDLRTIDGLWLRYSHGRFGFSVQKRIYEESGKDFATFSDSLTR